MSRPCTARSCVLELVSCVHAQNCPKVNEGSKRQGIPATCQSPRAGGQCCRRAWGNDGGLRGLSRSTRHDLQSRGVGECWLRGGVGFLTVHTHNTLSISLFHTSMMHSQLFCSHTCMHGNVRRRPAPVHPTFSAYSLRTSGVGCGKELRTDLFAFVWATLFGMPRHLNVKQTHAKDTHRRSPLPPPTTPDDHAMQPHS